MEFCVELPQSVILDDSELDKIAAQGVAAISAAYDLVESQPKETLRERASALAARGIKADTAHPRFGLYNSDNSLVNQYALPRGVYLEQLKAGFERMSLLGVKTAPLHTGGACLPSSPEWALELCAESVRAVLPCAMDYGIVLTLENTFFFNPQRWDGGYGHNARPAQAAKMVYDDIDKLCRLIDGLATPFVKGCFDAGHAHYLGDLEGDHAAMGDRITLYHVHDNNRNNDTHLAPGYGTLDWEALGALMSGYKSEYIVYIEANPWMLGSYGHMIRETNALLSGGRRGECRRCLKCGFSILYDEGGCFCAC